MKTIKEYKEELRKLEGFLYHNREEILKEPFSEHYDKTIIKAEVLKNTIQRLIEINNEIKVLRYNMKVNVINKEDKDSMDCRIEMLRLQKEMI